MTLTVTDLHAGYDSIPVLHGITLRLNPGEIVAVVGRNGVGKTTLVKALMGVLVASRGSVILNSVDLTKRSPSHRARTGMRAAYQDRALFQDLTVGDNLRLNSIPARQYDEILDMFPDSLAGRAAQRAGTLSGGEQKMLAAACILRSTAQLLVMDEPTEGLQPTNVDLLGTHLENARSAGRGVLLIEQHLALARRLADRFIVLEKGQIVDSGAADQPDLHDRLTKRLVI